MNKNVLIVLAVIVVLGFSTISPRNKMKNYEVQLKAVDKEMQNVHSIIFEKMKMLGVSVDKYGDLAIRALNATFGESGSKAAFQFLVNQGTIPAEIMEKMNVAIDAGYNEYKAATTTKIDVARVYEKYATDFPVIVVAWAYGYPTKPFDELGKILTTEHTQSDFKNGTLTSPSL